MVLRATIDLRSWSMRADTAMTAAGIIATTTRVTMSERLP
jgi:hypothetical protein